VTRRLEQAQVKVDQDIVLARAFATGEANALRSAYQRWGGLIHALAVKSVGPGDADDVTQQVFVSAWQSHSRYQVDQAPLGAWLVGIARHRIADHLSHRHRKDEDSADPNVLLGNLDQRPAPNAMTPERIDQLLLLWEELERIGNPQRQIMVLAFFEDSTHAQISQHLDMPLRTVKSHIARTLRRLETRLEAEHASRT